MFLNANNINIINKKDALSHKLISSLYFVIIVPLLLINVLLYSHYNKFCFSYYKYTLNIILEMLQFT